MLFPPLQPPRDDPAHGWGATVLWKFDPSLSFSIKCCFKINDSDSRGLTESEKLFLVVGIQHSLCCGPDFIPRHKISGETSSLSTTP